MKCFKLKDPVYDTSTWFVYNCTKEELNEWCSKKFKVSIIEDDEKLTEGICREINCKNGTAYIMWVRSVRETIYSMGVIAHELFHLVMLIMCHIGLEISEDSEEAYAYYYEYLFKLILGGVNYED